MTTRGLRLAAVGVVVFAGCAGARRRVEAPLSFVPPPLMFDWRRELISDDVVQAWTPIERSAVGVDPAHGRLFVGVSDGFFRAVGAGDGATLWSVQALGAVHTEAVYDAEHDMVFYGSDGGAITMARASDGSTVWRRVLRGVVRQPVVLDGDVVYVAAGDDTVTALARTDGRPAWRYRREGREGFAVEGYAGLALRDARLYTGFGDGTIAAISASDGTVLWEHDTTDDIDDPEEGAETTGRFFDVDTTPVLIDETVYAASLSAGLYALGASRGSVQWRRGDLTGITGLAAAGHAIVGGTSSGSLFAVDGRTGETLWQRNTDRGAATSAVSARGLVIFAFSQGGIGVVRAETGELVQSIDTGRGSSGRIVIRGTRAFAVSNGGNLLAFHVR